MNATLLKYPGSKWLKHQAIEREPEFRGQLPETRLWSRDALYLMLDRYDTLFLKPTVGGGGYGILKIERAGSRYVLRNRTSQRVYANRQSLYWALLPILRSRRFIIQQGIPVLTINTRPIDFRVLLLRPGEHWELMGVMAKCAAHRKYVTNHCNGGDSLTFAQAAARSMGTDEEESLKLEEAMGGMGLRLAESLNRHFPNVRELGLDIAMDGERRMWLLEANTRPQYQLFRDHPDRQLYFRIRSLIRSLRKPRKPRTPLRR